MLTVRDCYRAAAAGARGLRPPAAHAATARLFSTLDAGPVIIVTTAAAVGRPSPNEPQALKAAGATLIEGVGDLRQDLRALVPFDISTLLLEGGAAMHAAAWQAGVDRSRARDRGADGAR